MSSPTFTALRAPSLGAPSLRPAAPASRASATPDLSAHVFPRDATLVVVDGDGLRLRVLAGEVWITEERSLVDLVIRAGESCPLTRPGCAVIEVCGRARLVLEPEVAGATARVVRVKMTRTGPWRLLHRRPGVVARIGTALDRAIARMARWCARSVLRPMMRARARRVVQVRY